MQVTSSTTSTSTTTTSTTTTQTSSTSYTISESTSSTLTTSISIKTSPPIKKLPPKQEILPPAPKSKVKQNKNNKELNVAEIKNCKGDIFQRFEGINEKLEGFRDAQKLLEKFETKVKTVDKF